MKKRHTNGKKNTFFFLQNPSLGQNLLKLKMCKLSFNVPTKTKKERKKSENFPSNNIIAPPKAQKLQQYTFWQKKCVNLCTKFTQAAQIVHNHWSHGCTFLHLWKHNIWGKQIGTKQHLGYDHGRGSKTTVEKLLHPLVSFILQLCFQIVVSLSLSQQGCEITTFWSKKRNTRGFSR